MEKIYKYEQLFNDIPDDPDNVMFTIPPELTESVGWEEGDEISIKLDGNSIYFKKSVDFLKERTDI